MQVSDKTAQFDLAKTISWYNVHQRTLQKRAMESCKDKPDTPQKIFVADCRPGKKEDGLKGVVPMAFDAFPPAAQERVTVQSVRIQGPAWFHRVTKPSMFHMTYHVAEALSPTAIFLSTAAHRHANDRWVTDVTLYDPPHGIVKSKSVRRLILQQASMRELAYSMVMPDLYDKRREIVLSNGSIVEARDCLIRGSPLFNTLPPISLRASSFCVNVSDWGKMLTALSENMCEAIAAYLLGFAYQPEGDSLVPFAGRDKMYWFVQEYLLAEGV